MYYLLLILLYPIALLPFPALYLVSDIACFFIFYVFGYRKQVVMDNLLHAFPEMTPQELRKIRKQFYRNFCDQWFEMIKLLTISREDLNKHLRGNWSLLDDLGKRGINVYVLLGHTFNWEWGSVACQYNISQQFAGVYLPVKSQAMNRVMERIRTRSGAWLISMKAKKAFQKLQGTRFVVGLIADQNPSNINTSVWLPFMHREAPFFKGPEILARRDHAAVVFAGIRKVKRGYYELWLQHLTDNATGMPAGDIMNHYVNFMEQQLHDQPENWLWTHKRWKHNKV